MNFLDVDCSHRNIVIITVLKENPSPEEMTACFLDMDKIYLGESKRFLIYDFTKIKYLPAKYRIQIGSYLKKNIIEGRKRIIGSAYIIKNQIDKLLLNGVFLIQKPQWPTKIVANMHEAKECAQTILSQNGLDRKE